MSRDQIVSSFEQICGYAPDEYGLVLLQRLPGLGTAPNEDGTRSFVDEDLADVCRAGDVVSFITDPFNLDPRLMDNATVSLGALGQEVASLTLGTACSSGKLEAATSQGIKANVAHVLLSDVVRVGMESGCSIDVPVTAKHVVVPYMVLDADLPDCSNAHFRDSFFVVLEVGEIDATKAPRFEACYIGELRGRKSRADLPKGIFDAECEFDYFQDPAETNSAVLRLDLPLGVRVMLTMLRKLYQQSGSGRKLSAFHRGLDHNARRLVADVLNLLQHDGLAIKYKKSTQTTWLPDRSKMSRVGRIIASPRECDDPLIGKAAELGS